MTAEDINARKLMSQASHNITTLFNNAKIPDWQGGYFSVDSGGDVILDQSIRVYMNYNITPTRQNVAGVPVGIWNSTSGKVQFSTNEFIFLGGKTAPPPPRVIPYIEYKAKFAVRYAFDAIVGLCSLFTLGLGVFMYMNVKIKIFVASSPRFLTL
jgi:hypothetical protein